MSHRKSHRREFLKGSLATVATAGLSASLLEACSGSPAPLPLDGAPPDRGAPDRPDAAVQAGEARPDQLAPPDLVPAPRPATTVRQRVVPVLPSSKQPDSLKAQWGVTQLGPGEAHVRRDLLQADALAQTPTGTPSSLLYFSHLTDVHIIDEESPARTINLDKLLSAAWHIQEAHSAQVLDAVVRKLRACDAARSLDFLLVTGDCIENNQKNELAWFLKILEGGTLTPNSGLPEDPISGPDNDPHDAMVAMGLGKIPFYAAMGNHDGLVQGNLPRTVGYSLVTGDPTRSSIGGLEQGRVNPPVCNPIPADEAPLPPRCIPTSPGGLSAGSLPADQERVHLSRSAWLGTVKTAPGSGLQQVLATSGDGDYLVEPVPGLPLRLLVLNTCAAVGSLGGFSEAKIEDFVGTVLKQAELDEVLVMVASHHPSDSIVGTGGKLRQKLNDCPNVILHLVGHQHKHQVTPRPGLTPQHGYYEVQTSGLSTWPQQGRLIELVDKRDGTAELWLTAFDYDTDHQPLGPIVAGSRFLALREIHSGAAHTGEGEAGDRNVILPVVLPSGLQKKLAALPDRPIESKLFA